MTADLAERKQRAAMARDKAQTAQFESRHGRPNSDEEEEPNAPLNGPPPAKRHRHEDQLEALYGSDSLGLKRFERKKIKGLMKRRNEGVKDVDKDDDILPSALAVGEIKRPKVDWDFEGDGAATDDEEELFGSGDENAGGKPAISDFEDSDEEDTTLSKFGRKMNVLLESQREKEADDELAEISDEEAEPTGSPDTGTGMVQPAAPGGPVDHQNYMAGSPVHLPGMGVPVDPNNVAALMTGQPPHMKLPFVNPGTGAGTHMSNSMEAIHGARLAVPSHHAGSGAGEYPVGYGGAPGGITSTGTQQSRAVGYDRMQSPSSGSSGGRHSAAGDKSNVKDGQDLRAELQQSLIRMFNRHSGRMHPRKVMDELKIKSKGNRFTIVKELLSVMCSMDATSNPNQKILELKDEYHIT
eukprot:Lankesteria_metandrocarpae@DN3927_c0_g1_i1.p1